MLATYWDIGKMIHLRQQQEGWGKGVIPRLAVDLRNKLADVKGFSARNIAIMFAFYKEYPDFLILPMPLAKLENDTISPTPLAKIGNTTILQQPVANLESDIISPQAVAKFKNTTIGQQPVSQLENTEIQ